MKKLCLLVSLFSVFYSDNVQARSDNGDMEKLEVIEVKPVLTANTTKKDDQNVLDKAQVYLNSIRSLRTDFQQISSDGQKANGTITLKKPNRMIMDYINPNTFQFFADGHSFIYIDKELNQVSYMSVDKTPAFFILKSDFSFEDKKIKILSVRDGKDKAEITLNQQDDPLAGEVTLVFSKFPEFQLDSWVINDAHGNRVIVSLQDLVLNIPLEDSLFTFKDPRRKYNERR